MSAPPVEQWEEVIREYLAGNLDHAGFDCRYSGLMDALADEELLDPYPEHVMDALEEVSDLLEVYGDSDFSTPPVSDTEVRRAALVAREAIASSRSQQRGPERRTFLVFRSRTVADDAAAAAAAEGIKADVELTGFTKDYMVTLTGPPGEILALRERLEREFEDPGLAYARWMAGDPYSDARAHALERGARLLWELHQELRVFIGARLDYSVRIADRPWPIALRLDNNGDVLATFGGEDRVILFADGTSAHSAGKRLRAVEDPE